MGDFKNTMELIKYCKNGGRVVCFDSTQSEGFDEDGIWSYSNGAKTGLAQYNLYSKFLPPKKTKKVKLLAYLFNSGQMKWLTEDKQLASATIYGWHRVPSEDKEIEIEE